MYRHLLGYWQEYQTFSSGFAEQEISGAIDQVERDIKAQREAMLDQELHVKIEGGRGEEAISDAV